MQLFLSTVESRRGMRQRWRSWIWWTRNHWIWSLQPYQTLITDWWISDPVEIIEFDWLISDHVEIIEFYWLISDIIEFIEFIHLKYQLLSWSNKIYFIFISYFIPHCWYNSYYLFCLVYYIILYNITDFIKQHKFYSINLHCPYIIKWIANARWAIIYIYVCDLTLFDK